MHTIPDTLAYSHIVSPRPFHCCCSVMLLIFNMDAFGMQNRLAGDVVPIDLFTLFAFAVIISVVPI